MLVVSCLYFIASRDDLAVLACIYFAYFCSHSSIILRPGIEACESIVNTKVLNSSAIYIVRVKRATKPNCQDFPMSDALTQLDKFKPTTPVNEGSTVARNAPPNFSTGLKIATFCTVESARFGVVFSPKPYITSPISGLCHARISYTSCSRSEEIRC